MTIDRVTRLKDIVPHTTTNINNDCFIVLLTLIENEDTNEQ